MFYVWVTCETNIILKYFAIISVFYFTCTCNHRGYVWSKTPKLFQICFSDVEHVGNYSWSTV